jgi:RND superfamily putative drug exporter
MNLTTTTTRLARWSATHPWRAIGAWVLLVAICFAGGSATGVRTASDSQLEIGESGRADEIARVGGLNPPTVENVLITARTGELDQAAAEASATEVTTRMRQLSSVSEVAPAVPSADGSALLVAVTMAGDPETASDRVESLQEVTDEIQRAHPEQRIEQVGGASVSAGVNTQLGQDFGRAGRLSLPITLAILAIAFGAIIAAGVPVVLALCSVFAAIGVSALVSHVMPSTPTINEVILLMGMAVGVDYSLFYLKREREERAKGNSTPDAIQIAAATSGHSVLVSGVAVVIAMAGLYVAQDVTFASLATGSIIVVAFAVLGSLTVLPALLAKLGGAVDRPRIPLLWRLTDRRDRAPRLWPALLRPGLNHPGITLTLALAALLALAQPALGLKLHSSGIEDLPLSIPAVQSYQRLTAQFPSTGADHVVAVQAPAEQAAEVEAGLRRLFKATRSDDDLFASAGVADRLENQLQSSKDGRVHTLTIATQHPENSAAARRSLDALRDTLVPSALAAVPDVRYAVGGDIAGSIDYSEHSREKLPWVMGFVLLLTLAVMMLAFRSVVIAISTVVINLLSAGAAFGILVLVFQGHWAQDLLGFRSTGVIAWMPMFLFVVLFGLSMDYHIFVLSRIREGVQRGLTTRDAVREGIIKSAGVVTSAAVVMVGVFAVFATLSMVEFKQLGIGLSAAVLLDAVVMRIVLLPALMTTLGRWNWWPGQLSRPERPRVTVTDAAGQSRTPVTQADVRHRERL